jgi:hypothetical protein
MAVNLTYAVSVSGSGISIQSSIVRSGSASIGLVETLNAAKTGTLSTRTSDTVGTLTMTNGHGITTGQIIDLYWSGGVRYGVTVGTVATNSVPFSLGAGDNLPIATTAITAVVQQTANLLIDGDETELLAIELRSNDRTARVAGHVAFYDAADDLIAEIDLVSNVPQVWDIAGGSANPFTGDPITYAKISTGGSSATETYQLTIAGVYDASP